MSIKPFITKDNFCIYCNASNSLEYVDLHGTSCKNMIYSIKYAKCTKCNHIYFLRWIKDPKSDELMPFYDDEKIIDDFSKEISDYAIAHRRILK